MLLAPPPTLLQVPGQREPEGQSVAVELGAGLAALVGAVLQEGVLVAVQVVHQVPIAAVLGDDVDGPCGGTGSGAVLGEASASASVRAVRVMTGCTRERWLGTKAKRLWLQANVGSFPASVTMSKVRGFPEPYFAHLLKGASNIHHKELS